MEITGKILIIDDEPGIREGCKRVLEPQGYTVETAITIREGLSKIQGGNFDLILLDVMMPDGRGIDILDPISKKDPEIVSIIITGYATVELAVEAIKLGAYDFISKPFDSDMLLMKVTQGLERRRFSQETKRLQSIEREATELARAKAEMERLDQFKTDFMLTVAHELRAPITALQSFLLSIMKGYVPPDQREEILQRAVDRVQELLELVNDLLTLAAAKDEMSPPQRKIFHIADALDKVAPLFRAQAQENGITFTVNVHQNPLVEANSDQMVQLWSNLVSNAIKYTPPNGQVVINLEEVDGWVIGKVEDTGIGITPEDQTKIFEDFFRTTQAKKFSRLGTGLGLSLVQRIVEIHGGTIEVDSEVGKGSRFTFRLPAVKSPALP
ncbi:MAG: hybrid sensor histidine kinase/response regulator [Chloroflexota bacterium]|nr:hybrid sensor histidine kinase/response regulator [Chloroflexota bacterium]